MQWILPANLSQDHMLEAVQLFPPAIGTDVNHGHEIKPEKVEPSLNVLPATITETMVIAPCEICLKSPFSYLF